MPNQDFPCLLPIALYEPNPAKSAIPATSNPQPDPFPSPSDIASDFTRTSSPLLAGEGQAEVMFVQVGSPDLIGIIGEVKPINPFPATSRDQGTRSPTLNSP